MLTKNMFVGKLTRVGFPTIMLQVLMAKMMF